MSSEDRLPLEVELRSMTEDDLDFVLELGDRTPQLWLDGEQRFPFRRQDLIAWIEDEDKSALVFDWEGETVGFALIDVDRTAAEIESFVLKKDYRGQGWGRRLFRRILDRLEKQGVDVQYLYTAPDNQRAIELYDSLGFKQGKQLLIMYRGL